jgi:hypothetical protein
LQNKISRGTLQSIHTLQNKIVTSIHTLHKIKSAGVLQNNIVTSIHSSTYIAIYSVNQKNVFVEMTLVCQRQRLPCTRGIAAAVAEEEAILSGTDGDGGDRQSRE